MIKKVNAHLIVAARMAIAIILSYYMNICLDQKTILPFLKEKIRTLM